MKLELKHLAPYLPYGLKVKNENRTYKIITINGFYFSKSELILNSIELNGGISSKEIKPILRPLSDLTKEIECNGKKVMPILEIAKVSDSYYNWKFDNNSLFHKSVFCNHENGTTYRFLINTNGKIFYSINTTVDGCFMQTNNPHLVMMKIFEMHFDVFGLIDAGLAININKLDKN